MSAASEVAPAPSGDDTAPGPTRWFVTDFLTSNAPSLTPPEDAPRRSDSADELLILNYKLPSVAPHLWHRCERRYCADGGANRLYDDMPALFPQHTPAQVRAAFVPDVIVGDLDSVRPEVLAFYGEMGTRCVDLSADQDTTDLHKAVTHMVDSAWRVQQGSGGSLDKEIAGKGWATEHRIFAAGALGGRFDHEMSNVSAAHEFVDTHVVLIGRNSMAFVVPANTSVAIVPDAEREGPSCGLVPMCGPAGSVRTSGLRWNLEGDSLEMGRLISTSNAFDVGGTGGEVRIETDAPLLWTTDVSRLWNDEAP